VVDVVAVVEIESVMVAGILVLAASSGDNSDRNMLLFSSTAS
jgi:hypothetical protein